MTKRPNSQKQKKKGTSRVGRWISCLRPSSVCWPVSACPLIYRLLTLSLAPPPPASSSRTASPPLCTTLCAVHPGSASQILGFTEEQEDKTNTHTHTHLTMGKRTKKAPKKKQKLAMADRPRKLTGKGKIKHKRGDLKMVSSRNVSFAVKQGKGGKWIKTGERTCNIHTVCDCVKRTDPARMRHITNR
ncbi:phosphoprotein lepp12 [Leishmania tarentolae]|uniref:Phosphoprotein lepp12 n=1 Tax=Leishmania tarentolae TaxID=5689 RepID=A0A640KV83_LEITA|nr:phosphoprotein lepp12 [Leishmania tarentolae]